MAWKLSPGSKLGPSKASLHLFCFSRAVLPVIQCLKTILSSVLSVFSVKMGAYSSLCYFIVVMVFMDGDSFFSLAFRIFFFNMLNQPFIYDIYSNIFFWLVIYPLTLLMVFSLFVNAKDFSL